MEQGLDEDHADRRRHAENDIAELGAAAIAPQQRRTAFVLKLPDAAAQGRLRNAQGGCAEGETAKRGDADEIAKTLEIHIGVDSYNRNHISDSPDLLLAAIHPGY